MYEKCLLNASKMAEAAKDGTLKHGDYEYLFTFDKIEWLYIITSNNPEWEVIRLSEKKLSNAKKWLQNYLAN